MSATCPLITVQPSRGLVDEKFQITVTNLPSKQEVTLHSLHQSEDKDFWEAFGHYVSDAKGAVKVAEDVSFGGTYEGTESMGLLWSMRPVPGSRPGLRLRKKDVQTPAVVQISVYSGHLAQGFGEQAVLARAVVERWYTAPGVHRVAVSERGVSGTLFLPPGSGRFPAVLDMWGGGGGLVEYRAALLASHGFVSFSLKYFPRNVSSDDDDVHLSYFETAFKILQEHHLVAGERVAVLGLSFGASMCLSMAAYSEEVQPKCCVCISGSHALPLKTSLLAVLEHLNKNVHKARIDEKNRVIWRDLLLPIPTDPDMKIDVGRIKCPLLVIYGTDDLNWPAAESAEDIRKMMEEAGNSHLLTVLAYPGAGHLIETPYSPHSRASYGRDKRIWLWGGRTKPHAEAQEHSWGEILAFLQHHLYSDQDPVSLSRL